MSACGVSHVLDADMSDCDNHRAMESVRSKGDNDEDDIDNSTFCRDSALLALCHRPLDHRMTERFRAMSSRT